MELNKIRLILDDSGEIISDYQTLPIINQYATNYLIEVAFKNSYETNRIYKVIFTVNGKESPAKILSPTSRKFTFPDNTESSYFWEYKLTQYETQFYQDELVFTLSIDEDGQIISNQSVSLNMTKQRYNKLTPVNLESDSTLNSVVYAVSNLNAVIDDRINTFEQSVNNRFYTVNTSITNLNSKIDDNTEAIYARISDVEEYYSSEIARVDADINAGDTRLDEKIDNAVNEAAAYTDRQLEAYNEYAHDVFITGDDVQQDLYPYIDRKTDEAKSYTDDKITELVDSAPGTLNTLREIAEALKDQDDVITAIETTIGEKADRSELDAKVTKLNHSNQIYATDSSGAEFSLTYSEGYEVGSIPIRDSNGNISVGETPYEDNDATSKKYVDEQVDTKLDKVTTTATYDRLYGVLASGNKWNPYTSSLANPYHVIIRNSSGYFSMKDPLNDDHGATKKYVDTLFNGAVVEITDTEVTLDMESNKEYRCTAETGITSLNINSFVAAPSGVREEWTIIYKTGSPITVNLPSNIKWAIANPVYSANKTYIMTFIRFGEYFIGIWSVEG